MKSASRDTLQTQRKIQQDQDRQGATRTRAAKDPSPRKAVQAGARDQPEQFPAQHLDKPGHGAELQLKPRFEAPDHRGSAKLQNFGTLINGGDSGIGRAVAVLYAREGADVTIIFLESTDDAEETRRLVQAEGRRCLLLEGDVKDAAFCDQAVQRTVEDFGRLDGLVNNAAFQEHALALEDLADERLHQTLDTNVGSDLHMALAAVRHLPRGGSIINTGSVTGLQDSAHRLDDSATTGAIHALTSRWPATCSTAASA
jgi:NADP-dependent 3-hydroxy acid dehydrogenase YdfG